VILLPATRPLYAALDPVDFRRSFDVLIAIAREQLGLSSTATARAANYFSTTALDS